MVKIKDPDLQLRRYLSKLNRAIDDTTRFLGILESRLPCVVQGVDQYHFVVKPFEVKLDILEATRESLYLLFPDLRPRD